MSALPDRPRTANPFATRRVRPGAIPYRFPEGQSVDDLVARLEHNRWRGQIVGPHGSGKSTLLAALVPAIERAGRRVAHVALHDGQRRLGVDLARLAREHGPTVLVIDGYEQLAWTSRLAVWRVCRRRGWGLVVSTHAPVRLPDLWRTTITPALARRIVGDLLEDDWSLVRPEDVDAALARHGEDLRESLFELYDVFQRRRERPCPPG